MNSVWGNMFRFSLQAALNVREITERLCAKEVALQEKAILEIDAKKQFLQNKITKVEVELTAQSKENRLNIEAFKSLYAFRNRVNTQIKSLDEEKEKENLVLQEKIERQMEATKNKRMLEILREKEEKRYIAKQIAMETKIMNEVAINQFIQKQK